MPTRPILILALCLVAFSQDADPKKTLWDEYVKEQRADETRKKEHKEKKIEVGGLTMKYEAFTVGKKPENGYPLYIALHGGGGAPKRVNDSQWDHMKIYYRKSRGRRADSEVGPPPRHNIGNPRCRPMAHEYARRHRRSAYRRSRPQQA